MSFLDRIAECNNAQLADYRPLTGFGVQLGWIRWDRMELLRGYPDVFVVEDRSVAFHPALADGMALTAALDRLGARWREEGIVSGWRGERYAIAQSFGAQPYFSIERAVVPLLGLRSWGFHLNGYVRRGSDLFLWIAERAHDKPTYPGELDNTVAGGHPEGLSLQQNVVKECDEEASIPESLAGHARPVGAITYCHEAKTGLKPDEMFCFDLELPAEFKPIPNDGEVAAFHLMPVEEVMEIVRTTDRFKYNCALVLTDFFVRHGFINPDTEPDYGRICAGLSQGSQPTL